MDFRYDLKVFFICEIRKIKGHGEIRTVADDEHYLRIFGLSFSGKYRSQNGQWKFIPDPSIWGFTTKIFLQLGQVISTAWPMIPPQ